MLAVVLSLKILKNSTELSSFKLMESSVDLLSEAEPGNHIIEISCIRVHAECHAEAVECGGMHEFKHQEN